MDPGRDHEFAEFVDGRFTALQRFAYLLTGEWHLAEDLVQTALTKGVVPPELLAQRQRAGPSGTDPVTRQQTYTPLDGGTAGTASPSTHTYARAGTYTFSYTIKYCGNNGWVPVTKTVKVTVK